MDYEYLFRRFDYYDINFFPACSLFFGLLAYLQFYTDGQTFGFSCLGEIWDTRVKNEGELNLLF
jgi:hypothetical protein